MKSIVLLLGIIGFSIAADAQTTFHTNGVQDERPGLYAITGVTLHVDYKTVIEGATLLVRDGKIEQAGKGIALPKGAVTYDLTGYHIYPSFIDLQSEYGITPLKRENGHGDGPQLETNKKGAYGWNQAIKPETNGLELFKVNGKDANALREIGFGMVLTHQNDGIARGSGVLVSTASIRENEVILKGLASAHYSFDKDFFQPTKNKSLIDLEKQSKK